MGHRYCWTISTHPGGAKFLLVVVDYFTKWIEAEPLTIVIAIHMIMFMWKNILMKFSTLIIKISDNGTHCEGITFKG